MDTTEKTALENALNSTAQLLDEFNCVMHKDVVKFKEKPDFSKVIEKIAGPEEKTVQEEKIEFEDPRCSMTLSELSKACSCCVRCKLCETRKNTVFGEGCSQRPEVLVIGEGPGENEDLTGRPFVGKAGQFLDKWLAAISLYRDKNVYIANIVKCRPPENREPLPDEKTACKAFIEQQIKLIKPKAILCVGREASRFITGQDQATMESLRGRFMMYDGAIPVICTFHPAAVLRNIELKRPVWEDLKKLAQFLNLEVGTKK